MNTMTYRYKPSSLSIGIAWLFCGALAGYAITLAITNDRGLIINGLVRLSMPSATVFFYCLGLLPLAGFVLSTIVLISNLFRTQYIELTHDKLMIPTTGISGKQFTIAISRISNLSFSAFGDSKYLYITRGNAASRIMIARSFFLSHEHFEDFCRELSLRVPQNNNG